LEFLREGCLTAFKILVEKGMEALAMVHFGKVGEFMVYYVVA
jgi:hypothetical protein